MIVLDTSAMIEFLLVRDDVGLRVREAVSDTAVAAPYAIDLECASVLRGLVLGGRVPGDVAESAIELLDRTNLRRFDHAPLMRRVWELRHDMWPYDAVFAALAEYLDMPLATLDKKFAGVPGIRCEIRDLRD
ncbi:type II toxin-antitoxin system VapC family toxin [Glycomyces harbinensis]|uniref:Ribonuclease VapC n=1 Tax=Glycomyces harbinensis TaxID=58114 RepID=A0A1G6V8A6_9ACTN|nr:type II toxin-antitoxin system VapC family toxin [Glycomyces harbinensis]SDD49076.1 Predicted nucleic acid-binding protein, contains PIN domain [Glycomyces harbinensis]